MIVLCLPFLAIDLIQTALFTNGPMRSLGYPDFSLLLVIFSGLQFKRTKTLEIAFSAGLVREFFTAGGMGPYILIFMGIALFTNIMQSKIYQENPVTLCLSIGILTMGAQFFFAVADYHSLLLPATAWGTIMGVSVLSGLISIPMAAPWQKAFPKRKRYY